MNRTSYPCYPSADALTNLRTRVQQPHEPGILKPSDLEPETLTSTLTCNLELPPFQF